MKKQKDLYAIGLILYRLSYLSSIKQHDDRRNYLIRIKIDHFLNLLTESKILNNKIYSKSNLKPINGELEGDKLLRKLTDDSYQMQRKFISEIDQEEKETILMNIKNKLSL